MSICSGFEQSEWVICRVFKKSSLGNTFVMGKLASSSYGEEVDGSPPPPKNLPPLMDIPTHVSCFSNVMEGQKAPDQDMSSLFFPTFIPMSTTLYDGSFMSLFESHGFEENHRSKKDREMLSFSEETGLTTEIKAQIYCDNEIGMNSFEHCHWDC